MIHFIIQWVLPLIIAVTIAAIVQQLILFPILVTSLSMEPTLASGDRLLMARIHGRFQVKRQDIIAFYSQEYKMVMVKRVIGLPCDLVTIQNEGHVCINGEKLQEAYVHYSISRSGSFTVPEHKFMLLGDNRNYSTDSRAWAEPFIDEKDILGKAVFRVYPFRRMRCFGVGIRKNQSITPLHEEENNQG
jgi:signal peptidase I